MPRSGSKKVNDSNANASTKKPILHFIFYNLSNYKWYTWYFIFTINSGTPEVCLLPAGMAEKHKVLLYHPLYVITNITK